MRSKPLGCLTFSGLIGTLVALLLVATALVAGGGRLFSPGALSAKTGQVLGGVSSHAGLGGNCTACHTAPWEKATMNDRCLAAQCAAGQECHSHLPHLPHRS
jgi:hypothetical protein